jgi:uncharacterized protein (DUF952 family)/3-methyladenine DNA glycosylase AlkD
LTLQSELRAGVPARFAQDGFVHCSGSRATTLAVARDYFAGASEPLVALELDPQRLDSKLVFEAAAPIPGAATSHLASAELFPHVYGPLQLGAVRGGAVLRKRGDGFAFPSRLRPLGELLASSESAEALASAVTARLRSGELADLAALRRARRELQKRLRGAPPGLVIELGAALVASGAPGARVFGSELVRDHPGAIAALRVREVKRLAGALASWSDVDVFACMIAGQAFRGGSLADAELARWSRSRDRWWRRAALVATVPLNVAAQGGSGDARRTLRVCARLLRDRDDMVVKALSWALRALAEREPRAVRDFVRARRDELAPRALREVERKLRTGRKNP